MPRYLALLLVWPALAAPKPNLGEQLLAIERQFYEDWKNKSLDSFQKYLADDSIAWGAYGAFDKPTQLRMQQQAEANCEVRGYRFTDFKVRQVGKETAVVTYRVDQEALCGGAPVPTPLTNASIYINRNGRWLNIFRSGLPMQAMQQ